MFTFPDELLADDAAYRAAALAPNDEQAARRRRDLALAGFTALRDRLEEGVPLEAFLGRAVGLVAPLIAQWRRRWEAGPLGRTGERLDALRRGDGQHRRRAEVTTVGTEHRLGMCGHRTVMR